MTQTGRQRPISQMQAVSIEQTSFSGPLPHPNVLAQYNQVVPDAAERILRMAEEQSAHRRLLERRHQIFDIGREYLGLAAGLVVTLGALWLSYQLVLAGQTGSGLILSGATLVSLVGVFVYGSRNVKDERLRKQRMLLGRGERAD